MPSASFNMRGERRTGEFRVRPSIFGHVMEELIEHQNHSKYWRRITWPVEVEITAKPKT
jgi:hypothetical protein